MHATETVNSWENTRKLVVSECLTTTHSNHLSHTSSGKKNQKCLFWKCKLLFFIYSQSRSWICFLHHVCMEIWCLFNCFRKRLWRLGNLQSPSKISLKSLFSIAKGKEERMRTHRAQFNTCLKVMSCPCCWICCWHFNGKKIIMFYPYLSCLHSPASITSAGTSCMSELVVLVAQLAQVLMPAEERWWNNRVRGSGKRNITSQWHRGLAPPQAACETAAEPQLSKLLKYMPSWSHT